MQVLPKTVDELKERLILSEIDVEQYGKGSAKTLHQLLEEIKEGESSLSINMDDGKLKRTVRVLLISIKRSDGKILIETNQTFHETESRKSYSRQRNCLLAEKLHSEEDLKLAINRSLTEELGISSGKFVLNYIVPCVIETKYSQSYPGLLCEYYTLTVTIPSEDLSEIPDNYEYTEYFSNGLPRVTATWKWL